MKLQILKCKKCDTFTLEKTCPKCNEKAENPKPAKYSETDKLSKYRNLARKSN
ncbi:ribosome biogenesis protein [Candidatus Woesearchaeota archaeon]|jgi:H/ACA ribonucleoprotein complex subunit 3|nr:ribosome biogenesis protein [Candidatus Woesearchaeota archaeon]MBT7237859.1 ribosome biogenesis protein [Candidatus Woesearchaeota archaeon]